jgi:uncharacterized protein (DUF58 family)
MVVLVSDFLAPIDRLAPELLALAAGGHEVVLFQVLDPTELQFNFGSAAMFEDLESRSSLFIEPSSAREEYLRKMEVHSSSLREGCQKIGASYHRLDTSRPLEFALFDFLRARMQHRKGVKRFHGARQRPSARPL